MKNSELQRLLSQYPGDLLVNLRIDLDTGNRTRDIREQPVEGLVVRSPESDSLWEITVVGQSTPYHEREPLGFGINFGFPDMNTLPVKHQLKQVFRLPRGQFRLVGIARTQNMADAMVHQATNGTREVLTRECPRTHVIGIYV